MSKDIVIEITDNTDDAKKLAQTKKVIEDNYNKMVPPSVQAIRNFVNKFDPKDDRYSESILAQVYTVARKTKTGSISSICKGLEMPTSEFKYYMDQYPEFASAMRMGLLDGKEDMKEGALDALYRRAIGTKVKETKTENIFYPNEEGDLVLGKTVKVELEKDVPPDTGAALEILRKLDPTWVAKQQLDVNLTNNLIGVAEDVSVEVDYRKLPPDVLKQLLESSKEQRDQSLNRREDGSSVLIRNKPALASTDSIEISDSTVQKKSNKKRGTDAKI